MKKTSFSPLLAIICLVASIPAQAQVRTSVWQDISEAAVSRSDGRQIIPERYRTLRLSVEDLREVLSAAPMEMTSAARNHAPEVELPAPDGSTQRFHVWETPVMAPGLARKYPGLRTYAGQGIDHPEATLRMDVTTKGFHAMILAGDQTVFIDPYSANSSKDYICYYKKDFTAKGVFSCLTEAGELPAEELKGDLPELFVGSELRTYRLAVAATGEYTAFHGGVAGAMSAMVTSLNRINGIYETEIAVRLIMVENNDTLIFSNAATDPYTNNDGGTMLGQNQQTVDARIGPANYDIGHVFSTGGGGIASLGSVCSSINKARGVTGSPAPVGDAFDVDYVAHEMGHQFGGNHTFNSTAGSCGGGNRAGSAAYEPGSGTTIMAYAGICGTDNVQNNSDAFFHTHSFTEIYIFTHSGNGNSCPVTTATGNTAPTVEAGDGGFFVPVSTPFVLTGSGSDPDGDAITYSWEQYDKGPATTVNNPSGSSPIYRAYAPSTSPSRTFPRIQNVISNTQTTGERLVTYARPMTFRLTTRDNKSGGGGVNYDQMAFEVTDLAGPFVVTAPNTSLTWTGGTFQEITWDVANTHVAPVNCKQVNILLSTDGGFTYPLVLATNESNDGSAFVLIPEVPGTTNRIRVQAADNIFFDISNTNFTIVNATVPGFSILSANDSLYICPGGSASYQILTSGQLGFSNDVSFLALGLPAGITAAFSPDTVTPGSSVTLTLSQTGALPLATYAFNLVAVPASGGSPQVQGLVFTTLDGLPAAPLTTSPADGTIGVSRSAQLSWAPVAGASSYNVQISASPTFTTLVSQVNNITGTFYSADPQLASYTIYFWRVQAVNLCGPGNYSAASAFQTGVCQSLTNAQVPVTIPLFGNPATVTSTLGVSVNGAISDVNVLNVAGVHTSVSDLTFTLISPAGTEVTLVANPCTAADENFDFNFDDEAAQATLPCPPTDGGVYQPVDSLSAFDGQNAFGVWTLRIRDNVNFDGGTLNSWNLEVCVNGYPNPILITNDTLNVPRGSARFITDTLLKVNDQISNPFNITYTLVSLPEHGELKKNGATLAIGQTFSQNDITTGLLQYDHDASYTVADSFRFTVNNQVGGWLGIPVFHIKVGFATDVENDLPGLSLEVFPNPADQEIAVRVRGELSGAVSAELTDLRGRMLRSYQGLASGGFETRWNVSDLPAGIYMLQFRSEEGVITHKVIIR